MTNLRDNRVLCRLGARELTISEREFVMGAQVHTFNCTAPAAAIIAGTRTGPGDGDACGDTDFA